MHYIFFFTVLTKNFLLTKNVVRIVADVNASERHPTDCAKNGVFLQKLQKSENKNKTKI